MQGFGVDPDARATGAKGRYWFSSPTWCLSIRPRLCHAFRERHHIISIVCCFFDVHIDLHLILFLVPYFLISFLTMVLRKHELEAKLKDENQLIQNGVLREENPLDLTADFSSFLEACRAGDLKRCQELISAGVNINGKDSFDYTPLIIVRTCSPARNVLSSSVSSSSGP